MIGLVDLISNEKRLTVGNELLQGLSRAAPADISDPANGTILGNDSSLSTRSHVYRSAVSLDPV